MRPSVLVLPVVLLSVLIAPVAASPADHTVPLDRGFERVGETSVDGTTYAVYRYDNLLPYASGYEVFVDGRRVEDPGTVRRVARVYAWRTAVRDRVSRRDVEALEMVAATASRAGSLVGPPVAALNSTLDLVDGLRGREVPYTDATLWDVAMDASPSLRGSEDLLTETRDRLLDWRRRVEGIAEDASETARVSRELRSDDPEDVNYTRLPRTFDETAEGLREVEEVSRTVAADMSEATNFSERAVEEVEGVRFVGDELAPPLRRVVGPLRNATAAVTSFRRGARRSRLAVESAASEAREREASITGGARRRSTATERVYATGVALLLAAVAAALYARRRERNGDDEGR